MNEPDVVARVAGLLADPARAQILLTLIDGSMRPAGELAFAANISAQSARYFQISSPEVASAVESLSSLSMALPPRRPPGPAIPKSAPVQFLHARTCYDHLAGELAVQTCAAMLKARWLRSEGRDLELTRLGHERLTALGVDLSAARSARRSFARACVDLTQRRSHIGGALGAALLEMYLARSWILRIRGSRAVSITPKGSQAFARICA